MPSPGAAGRRSPPRSSPWSRTAPRGSTAVTFQVSPTTCPLSFGFSPATFGPLTTPATVTFTETIGVPAGTAADSYVCSVTAVADGVVRARQSVTVTVPSDPVPPSSTTTITFNDASGRDRQLGGEYPAGIVNWGTNSWWLASPAGKFSTKSLSLNGNKVPALTESTFAFVTPRRLLSLEAFNSGQAPATVTLRCDGALSKQVTLAAGELATITTGWAVPCGTVSLGADNGWDTNFDNLVVDNTPLPATQQLLTLNTLSGQNRALNGVNTPAPNDLVTWGSGKWFLSGPKGAFNTRSVSLANGLTQGTHRLRRPAAPGEPAGPQQRRRHDHADPELRRADQVGHARPGADAHHPDGVDGALRRGGSHQHQRLGHQPRQPPPGHGLRALTGTHRPGPLAGPLTAATGPRPCPTLAPGAPCRERRARG